MTKTQLDVSIPDYKDWLVLFALADAAESSLLLNVTNGRITDPRVLLGRIEKNADVSPPGSPIGAGGTISVVIYPLEIKDKKRKKKKKKKKGKDKRTKKS